MKIEIQNKNFYSLDFLRGIAALSVFLFHIGINNKLKFSSGFKDLSNNGHLGVQIFFVISGFIIPYSMKKGNYNLSKIKTFFIKRLVRLHPPYLISMFLIFLINLIFHQSPYFNEALIKINITEFFSHFLYLNGLLNLKWLNQVYWTLAIEFQFYVFISLFFLLLDKDFWIWILILLILLFSSIVFPFHNLLTLHLPFFLIGISLFRLISQNDSFIFFIFYLIIINIIILYLYNFDFRYVIAGIFPVFFLIFTKKYSFSVFFGNISYSLYLIHAPISQALIKIGSYFCRNIYHESILIIITIIVTISLSYLFYRYIELPFKKFTSKLKY